MAAKTAKAATKAKAAKAAKDSNVQTLPALTLAELTALVGAIILTGQAKAGELAMAWLAGRIDAKMLHDVIRKPDGVTECTIGEMRGRVQTLRVQLLRAHRNKLYQTTTGKQLAPMFDEDKHVVSLYAAKARKAKKGTATEPAAKVSKAAKAVTSIADALSAKDGKDTAKAIKAMPADALFATVETWMKGAKLSESRTMAEKLVAFLTPYAAKAAA